MNKTKEKQNILNIPLDDFQEHPHAAECTSKEAWESIPHCPPCEE